MTPNFVHENSNERYAHQASLSIVFRLLQSSVCLRPIARPSSEETPWALLVAILLMYLACAPISATATNYANHTIIHETKTWCTPELMLG